MGYEIKVRQQRQLAKHTLASILTIIIPHHSLHNIYNNMHYDASSDYLIKPSMCFASEFSNTVPTLLHTASMSTELGTAGLSIT